MRSGTEARRATANRRGEVTDALIALRNGDADAMDRLTALVYADLRRVAHRQLRGEQPGHTLSTTALVHEAWLRLADQRRVDWRDRSQFFALAARAMRRVLVDYARRHRALRRGGGEAPLPLNDGSGAALQLADVATQRADELLALDDALMRLAKLDPRLCTVVEHRFFIGLTAEETAALLGVTVRTVERQWAKARAWLAIELGGHDA